MRAHEIIVDNFAGGGGASTGIEAAVGRPIDYAINHDPEAVAMHRANHPDTHHFCESVWNVSPHEIARGRPVRLGWFSPDCTFHSKARGGQPFRDRDPARRRRGLAGIVPRWLSATGMRVFMLENVEEFADWGPLLPDGQPCPLRRGLSFRRWHRQIENIVSKRTGLPYRIDMRELRAMEHGAPTTRKRLFVIGRCDGEEIVFPEPTHGPGLRPYRTAASCIDWSVPCASIFARSRPLADATLRRIARGVARYVVNNARPFIVPITRAGGDRVQSIDEPLRTITTAHRGEFALVSAFLAQHNSERSGYKPGRSADLPLSTITTTGGQQQLVSAFLARHYGGHENDGSSLQIPMHTITAKDHHSLVTAFLLKYYGTDQDPRIDQPLGTVTTRDRFGLVTVHGEPYQIVDIGMRMLTPRELYRAQSFPDSFVIDHGIDEHGSPIALTKTAQIRMCGNSVAPAVAEALVRANLINQRMEAVA